MATKELNTRILLKIDTLEAWESSSLQLKKGEAAFATTTITEGTTSKEVVLIKIASQDGQTWSQIPDFAYAKAADVITACKSTENLTTFVNNLIKNAGLSDNEAFTALAGRVTTVEGVAADNTAAIAVLNGAADKDGSVAKAIADAIAALDATVSSADVEAGKGLKVTVSEADGKLTSVAIEGNFDETYAAKVHTHTTDDITNFDTAVKAYDYATKTEAQGYANAKDDAIAAAQKAGDDAMAEAQKKVASVAAGDASVTIGGTATAPTVAAKLSAAADNALTLADDGLKVVIPAAAEYSIVKAEDSGDYAAVYNLTKDGAVVGASINIPKDMVVKSGSVVGDEIVLVLNDKNSTEIKIPVASLIEYVTSGSATGDMVVVNVSDDHKVTATITDGTVTLAKLTTEVQTAIGKAHTHENATVLDGITADQVAGWDDADAKAHEHANKELLDTYTQTEANLADAVAKKHAHENATVLDGITAQNITDWNDAVAKEHTHANGTVIDGISAEKVTAWDNAEKNAKDYADEVLEAAKAYADEQAANTTYTAAADGGLKLNEDNSFEIDNSVTFIFNCGNATM